MFKQGGDLIWLLELLELLRKAFYKYLQHVERDKLCKDCVNKCQLIMHNMI